MNASPVRKSHFAPLLFALTLLLFVCVLHVFIPARTSWFLIVAILVGEWGHYAALLALLLAALSWRRGRLGRITAVLALVAALMALWPTICALKMASGVAARTAAAFHPPQRSYGRTQPFDLLDLVRLVQIGAVDVTEHVYSDEGGGKPLTLDLYQAPAHPAAQPLVVIIHGGSWSRGNKRELPAINRYLASHGYAVASINYRYAPKFPFPAAVDDLFRALDYLESHATELQLDPTRVALLGRSAGAQIALSAGYSGREPNLRGVIAFYAPTDLVFGYTHPSARWVIDSEKTLRNYLGGTPQEKPAEYAAASPINFVSASTPPTLLVHGGLDSVVWPVHSAMLDQRLQAAQRPHLYLAFPWATHGCDANLSGPSGQLSLYAIERFLAAVFALPNE